MKNRIQLFAYLFCTTLLMFSSCKESAQTIPETGTEIKGIATPIQLLSQKTSINLQDYFSDVNKIDSFQKDDNLLVEKESKSLFQIQSKSNNLISNLRTFVGRKTYDIPVFANTKKQMLIAFSDQQHAAKKVEVKGQMSNWTLKALDYKDGKWQTSFDVFPGNYQYVLVVDGKEQLDAANPKQISNGMGGFNSIKDMTIDEQNIPHIQLKKLDAEKIIVSSSHDDIQMQVYFGNNLLSNENIKQNAKDFEIKIPSLLENNSSLRIFAANKMARANDLLVPIKNNKIVNNTSSLSRKDWQTNIYYFLMVDRFKDGNLDNTRKVNDPNIHPKANYFGGDLEGVVEKIKSGYFTQLGVNSIWLSPITQNPETAYGLWPEPKTTFSGYHGYWPISSTKVDDRFGSEDVLKSLITEAHNQDLNVIVDYVANHVHEEHPVYKQHPDWATNLYLPDGSLNTERWDEHRLTTWFDTFLPTLDFSKPEVIEQMTDSATYWVTNYELDGFRHDATKHIQLEFWRTLTSKVKAKVERPVFQIGETYGSPDLIKSYINSGMLNSQFDFNLYDAATQAFAVKESKLTNLAAVLKQSLNFYGSHHLMGNISGNQDRARFITYASGDLAFSDDAKKVGWTTEVKLSDKTAYNRLAMLHAFNMTIPGLPIIYYGDEYGAIGAGDPDNRRWMRFEELNIDEQNLKSLVEQLTRLRKENMALMYGDLKFETATDDLLIYSRKYFENEVYIIFNKSSKAQELDLNLSGYQSVFSNLINDEITANAFDVLVKK